METLIQVSIKACDGAIADLSSLNDDLEQATAKVTQLKKTFNDLSILMKADAASAIGVIVTVSDADGD